MHEYWSRRVHFAVRQRARNRSYGRQIMSSFMANMANQDRSDWRQLCKQAATETDISKLLELTDQILRLLDEQSQRPAQLAS